MNRQNKSVVELACSKIKDEDILHRGFLKPIEIALKTYATESQPGLNQWGTKNEIPPGLSFDSLPCGLKIAVKESIRNNKYTLNNLIEIDGAQDNFQKIKTQNQDNILSIMKSNQGLQLAICICMYSEDKKMLKNTLAGVGENIAVLVTEGKINPDKIGVFVMMDGIEKVDSSIVEYFEELEKSNNINLGDNIRAAMNAQDLLREKGEDEDEEEQLNNINNFLFNAAELNDRNERRFYTVRNEYDEIKKMLVKIQQLKKQKPLYDSLPGRLKPFFVQEARLQRQKDYSETAEQAKKIKQQLILEEYAYDLRKSRTIVMKALQQAQRQFEQYIKNREELAYLATFRNKIRIMIQSNGREGNKKYLDETNSFETMNDEFTEDEVTTNMNLFMCVKYKNSGKLSSHNWFFNGFCKELKPKYAVLLDVGLRPEGKALFKMYKHMRQHIKVGGVCGYMSLKIQRVAEDEEVKDDDVDFLSSIFLKFADIQRTQQVEYHFAHLIDKPFESAFGFIHVLPGAFSAYNMRAIIDYDNPHQEKLLKHYFKSIDEKLATVKVTETKLTYLSIFLRTFLPDFINSYCVDIPEDSDQQMLYNENIYLAEDRILCMGIHQKGFDMQYLPDSYAEVDPIKTVHGLLGQRKRWINGSFFAFQKVKKELKIHEEQNGVQFCLRLQIFYLTLMNSMAYFAPSMFLFTVHIAMEAFRADVLTNAFSGFVADPSTNTVLDGFVYTMDFIYVMLICSVVFFSLHLTNGNKKFKPYIYAISTLFGIFAIIVFLVLIVDVIRGLLNNDSFLQKNSKLIEEIPGGYNVINALRWILISTTVIYAIPVCLYWILFCKAQVVCEILLGVFSFLFYGPTYLNILNIYSLSRIDDISWGTKGLDGGSSKNAHLKDTWKIIKYVHVSKYVIWNIIIGVIALSFGSTYISRFFITIVLIAIMGSTLAIKILIGLWYMIKYKIGNTGCCQREMNNMQDIPTSRVKSVLKKYESSIFSEIKTNLVEVQKEQLKSGLKGIGSFIQISKTKTIAEKSYKKLKDENVSRSKIVKTVMNKLAKGGLATIEEEDSKKKGKANVPKINSKGNSNTSQQLPGPVNIMTKGLGLDKQESSQNLSSPDKKLKDNSGKKLLPTVAPPTIEMSSLQLADKREEKVFKNSKKGK